MKAKYPIDSIDGWDGQDPIQTNQELSKNRIDNSFQFVPVSPMSVSPLFRALSKVEGKVSRSSVVDKQFVV